MKKIIPIVALLTSSMLLFATWNVGTIVDDFGDPTGDGFVYTTLEGTFSNSATSNSTAVVRILARFSIDPYPTESWNFEIHDYNWDNPTEDFYDTSVATIKIKEESGTVSTFTNKNSEYSHNWNSLSGVDGKKFTEMLRRNNLLKVNISIERYKYNFSIDCSDFNDVYDSYFNSLKPKIGFWYFSSGLSSEFIDYLKKTYASIGITKNFPEGSYCYYGETNTAGKDYLYFLNLDNEDYDKNKYVSFDLNLYSLDKSHGATPTEVKIESRDVKSVTIIAPSGKLISLRFKKDSTYTWTAQESIQNIVDSINIGSQATLRISTTDNQTIDIPLDKEFAEYFERAKSIQLI